MSPEQLPPHALFVQWGRFRAGAFGIPAIGALILLAVAAQVGPIEVLWYDIFGQKYDAVVHRRQNRSKSDKMS